MHLNTLKLRYKVRYSLFPFLGFGHLRTVTSHAGGLLMSFIALRLNAA